MYNPEQDIAELTSMADELGAPDGTSKYLPNLFTHPINEKLVKLETFCAVWQKCSWTSLCVFSKLLDYVPRELMSALSRAVEFWESLASLCEPEMNIRQDKATASEIEGLWPACCSADMKNFREKMRLNGLFPLVQDGRSRDRIQAKIESLSYRIPSLGIIIAESRTLHCMVKWLLRGLGDGRKLAFSTINIDAHKSANEKQYYLCFLAAARACGCNNKQILQEELDQILDQGITYESSCPLIEPPYYPAGKTLVSAPPNGVWAICAEGVNNDRYSLVTDYFYLKVLCYPESGFDSIPASGKLVRPYLTMQRLIKDFFESFFGPAVRIDELVSFEDPLPRTATFQEHKGDAWISDDDMMCHTSTLSSPLLADLSSHMIQFTPPDEQSRKEVGKGVIVERSNSYHSRVGELDYYTHGPLADAAIAIDDTISDSSQSLTEEESFNFESYDDTRYSSFTMNSATQFTPPDGQSRKEVGKGVIVEKSNSYHSRVGELDYYTHGPLADAAIAIDDTISDSSQSLTEEESFNFGSYDDTGYSSYTMNSAYNGDLHRTCKSDNETLPPSPESLQREPRLSVLSDQKIHKSKYRLSGIELGERQSEPYMHDRKPPVTSRNVTSIIPPGHILGTRIVINQKHNWRSLTYQNPDQHSLRHQIWDSPTPP